MGRRTPVKQSRFPDHHRELVEKKGER
ncbi:hypothetical protein CCACVL1_24610 [Corchorus capsularis]|uniref:Uncharacterized protein n=1 Tax=Corchorus capsularis TaxID=210143 RepID=A0A1R3GNW8_COCAP|nr:hypothetical protein CCACVL1_24610 [Corchorus capsularis]